MGIDSCLYGSWSTYHRFNTPEPCTSTCSNYKRKKPHAFEHRWEAWWELTLQRYEYLLIIQTFEQENQAKLDFVDKFWLIFSDDKLTHSPIYACMQIEVAFVSLLRTSAHRMPLSLANSMALLFCMTNSLGPLLILSHQTRRWGQFRKHIIDGINLPYHLQQEEKSGKRKIARCSILKLMNGGQAKPSKLGNLFLGEIASHSIFLESYSQQAYQLWSRIFI